MFVLAVIVLVAICSNLVLGENAEKDFACNDYNNNCLGKFNHSTIFVSSLSTNICDIQDAFNLPSVWPFSVCFAQSMGFATLWEVFSTNAPTINASPYQALVNARRRLPKIVTI